MHSICFIYPDKSGGNITDSNSVCKNVDSDYIKSCLRDIGDELNEKSLIVAVPEVPLEARLSLLHLGKSAGAYNVAAILSDEATEFKLSGGLDLTDLLIINEDEASALIGFDIGSIEENTDTIRSLLSASNPNLTIIVTLGKNGSFVVDITSEKHIKAPEVKVVSTAGAGDAYTAGVICGLCLGYDLYHKNNELSAADIGNYLAWRSIQCIHTIDDSITKSDVLEFIDKGTILSSIT